MGHPVLRQKHRDFVRCTPFCCLAPVASIQTVGKNPANYSESHAGQSQQTRVPPPSTSVAQRLANYRVQVRGNSVSKASPPPHRHLAQPVERPPTFSGAVRVGAVVWGEVSTRSAGCNSQIRGVALPPPPVQGGGRVYYTSMHFNSPQWGMALQCPTVGAPHLNAPQWGRGTSAPHSGGRVLQCPTVGHGTSMPHSGRPARQCPTVGARHSNAVRVNVCTLVADKGETAAGTDTVCRAAQG